jgi:predicted Ser/Thr protein kinase
MTKYVGYVTATVKEYGELAIREIQRAFDDSFEQTASMLLDTYVTGVAAFSEGRPAPGGGAGETDGVRERDMRDIERKIGVADRDKKDFRHGINETFSAWKRMGVTFDYTAEPLIRAAIEALRFPSRRELERGLTQPRFARQRAEWEQRRSAIAKRLMEAYGYCRYCAQDLIDFVAVVLKNKPVHKTPKNEGVEWLWPLRPASPEVEPATDRDA